MVDTPQRRYALTKIEARDYILPSNDGNTIYRIATYVEGPSTGFDDWPKDRRVWGVWTWTLTKEKLPDLYDEWGYWEFWSGMHRTRREAIDDALRG